MRFSTILATLSSVGATVAQTVHPVTVGANNDLIFNPNSISGVNDGDIIMFTFVSRNHTATQSSFNSPCSPLANGFNSGFQDAAAITNGTVLTSNFTVANASAPLWFYCQQTVPADHCQMGMVFSVNAPATGDHSFDAFQQAAMATANATNATTSSSVSSSASGISSSSDASPAPSTTSSAAPTDSSATLPDSSSASTASDSTSATSTSASSTPSSSSPARVLQASKVGTLLGGVGLLALVL